jgi:hypothetical protein
VAGILVRRLKKRQRCEMLILTAGFFLAAQSRRAGSRGSTSDKMADATIFRHALRRQMCALHCCVVPVQTGCCGLKATTAKVGFIADFCEILAIANVY